MNQLRKSQNSAGDFQAEAKDPKRISMKIMNTNDR